jgi:uncharacterized OsmC-like protein
MSIITSRFSIEVAQREGFEFHVKFDKDHYASLELDEPAPLGRDSAPNAARILAAAIGNCLAASLVFCLKKQKLAASGVKADVAVEIVRNDAHRLRIGKVDVTLHAGLPEGDAAAARCLETFEDFCMVTQSVRDGIDVGVRVVALEPALRPEAPEAAAPAR